MVDSGRGEQNGGSARSYQETSRTVGNLGHDQPDSGELVSLCIACARVNFRI
jgi:hypothetical protein